VILHTAWLYDLRGSLIESSSFYDLNFLEDGLSSLAWTVVLTVLSAIVPFILYKMDSFRCISLSAAETRRFPITVIGTALIIQAWNAAADALFAKGEIDHFSYIGNNCSYIGNRCSYIGNNYDWAAVNFQVCAFISATRDSINSFLPFICSLAICAIFMATHLTIYGDYLTDVLLLNYLVGLLSVALLPPSTASWLASRVPHRLSAYVADLRVSEVAKRYIASIMGLAGAVFVVITQLENRKVHTIVRVWWKLAYILLLLSDQILGSVWITSFEAAGFCFVGTNLMWSLL
jgi:hypothetical protein